MYEKRMNKASSEPFLHDVFVTNGSKCVFFKACLITSPYGNLISIRFVSHTLTLRGQK